MSTAQDLIKGSLRLLGVIASGETPSSSELSDGLSALSGMISSWSNDGFLVFKETIKGFDIPAGKSKYSVGPGGDLNISWPVDIKSATYQTSIQEGEYLLDELNLDQWADVNLKTLQSTLPSYYHLNKTYPMAELRLWPIPSQAGRVNLYALTELCGYDALTDELCLPPGYERMLRYNLAVELAPEFGLEPSLTVQGIASESKALVQRTNTKPVLLSSDAFGLNECSDFDIRRGY